MRPPRKSTGEKAEPSGAGGDAARAWGGTTNENTVENIMAASTASEQDESSSSYGADDQMDLDSLGEDRRGSRRTMVSRIDSILILT